MAETEVKCPLKDCVYNQFGGRCIRKVVTFDKIDLTGNSKTLRCDDYKSKLYW
jgi:hypothetical protein